jgi:hypothetical protein
MPKTNLGTKNKNYKEFHSVDPVQMNTTIPDHSVWQPTFDSMSSNLMTDSEVDHKKDLDEFSVRLALLDGNWLAAQHWVYKKRWNYAHKIPGDRTSAKYVEPIGDLLISRLNLCVEIHLLKPHLSQEHPANWFDAVAKELRVEFIRETFGLTGNTGKTQYLKWLHKHLNTLKDERNPYDFNTMPAHWRMVEAALDINKSKFSPNFYQKFWRGEAKPKNSKEISKHMPGFIKATEAFIASVKDPSNHVLQFDTKRGEFFLQAGQGRGVIHYPIKERLKRFCEEENSQ